MTFVLLGLLGLFVGAFGTLIGAGGGFILVPILLFAYPEYPPETVTAISMFCVFCNATSGTITYLFKRKVLVKAAIVFSIASFPGVWIGTDAIRDLDRGLFETIFGIVLGILGISLLFRKPRASQTNATTAEPTSEMLLKGDWAIGTFISFIVGIIASLLGIGGGIVHVPLLIHFLRLPIPIAVGTSHFILAGTAFVATLSHCIQGDLPFRDGPVLPLAIGLIGGAQAGAYASKHVKGSIVVRLMGIALTLVAVRLIMKSLVS